MWLSVFAKSMAMIIGTLLIMLLSGLAQAQDRVHIYDERGRYQGRLERDYSGRCCAIYDGRGRYQGRMETREPREPRSTGPRPDIRGMWQNDRRH